jgi:uncharacterized protein (DUF305 family)
MVTLVLAAAGCSDGDPESAVDPSKPYNQADVAFATDMIQHHAQALQIVDLTLGRDLDPEVGALADEIRTAQTAEIEQMVDLLDRWDHQPIPETSRDHSNAHGSGSDPGSSVPGGVSSDDLAALEAAPADEFEPRWLDLMLEHHQGAVAMASGEKDEGEHKAAVALASRIATVQGAQVRELKSLSNG